jgi:hypothetical protein
VLSIHGDLVDLTNILDNVNVEIWLIVGVEKQIISNSSISDGWAEDRDVILPAPIIDTIFIVDGFTHSVDDLAWSEDSSFFFLLFMHFFDQWNKERFEVSVSLVWSEHISDTVDSSFTKLSTI